MNLFHLVNKTLCCVSPVQLESALVMPTEQNILIIISVAIISLLHCLFQTCICVQTLDVEEYFLSRHPLSGLDGAGVMLQMLRRQFHSFLRTTANIIPRVRPCMHACKASSQDTNVGEVTQSFMDRSSTHLVNIYSLIPSDS